MIDAEFTGLWTIGHDTSSREERWEGNVQRWIGATENVHITAAIEEEVNKEVQAYLDLELGLVDDTTI